MVILNLNRVNLNLNRVNLNLNLQSHSILRKSKNQLTFAPYFIDYNLSWGEYRNLGQQATTREQSLRSSACAIHIDNIEKF